ncbi:MAG: 2-phospho-L-lactate guanylyltransferase [Nitrososphaerales archaeon]|nr:2-phospho-L-lactate guanylyltransferase [Nitrososphaerales archaeon]
MKRLAVVVPFKGKDHKSRLSPHLDESERAKLAHLMLADVLKAVRGAGLGKRCFVISSDAAALREAAKKGAFGIREKADAGVNSAVRTALRTLGRFDSFMILPSDLALLSPSDLSRVMSLARQVSVVVSPSESFNGTNLMIFSRSKRPRLSYDDNSFWAHLASSASKRLTVGVYTGRGVTFDLDSISDGRQLLRLGRDTAAARFLREVLPA